MKKIGLLLLLTAVFTGFFSCIARPWIDFHRHPPHEKLWLAWSADLQLLEKSGELPAQWGKIGSYRLDASDTMLLTWLDGRGVPFAITSPQGPFELEIFLIQWLEPPRYGVIIEYNLINLEDGNKIWEFSRNLPLGFFY